MSFWWHQRSSKIGIVADGNPHPVDECVLSENYSKLWTMRAQFDQVCRLGWYGKEWQDLANGRISRTHICY